jgi:hypothetical protein
MDHSTLEYAGHVPCDLHCASGDDEPHGYRLQLSGAALSARRFGSKALAAPMMAAQQAEPAISARPMLLALLLLALRLPGTDRF